MTLQTYDQEKAHRIKRGLLALAYKPIIFAAITSIIVATLVHYTLVADKTLESISLWYNLMLFVAVSRIAAGLWFKYGEENLLFANVLWYFVTFYSAFAWASAPLLIWPESPAYQSFLALVLAGMSGGTLGTLSAMPLAIPLYITICMTPLIWRLSIAHTETSSSMMLLGILYVIWISIAGIRAYRTVRDNVVSADARETAEQTVLHQALHDDLTDLPNRRLLLDRLQSAINFSRRSGDHGALLFIDLDNFKRVNDSLGHQTGDELLNEIAARLRSRLRESDTAARFGGDEFAVVIPATGKTLNDALAKAEQIAATLRLAVSQPISVGGQEMQITMSIGIAGFPNADHDAMQVLKRADAAMYEAKKAGRNCSRVFNLKMDAQTLDRLKTENSIRSAIARREFVNYYQPQVDHQGNLVGLEALVRWRRNGSEVIEPGAFLGIAEDCGLIKEIQDQVLEQVVDDINQITTRASNIGVSVNISAGEFTRAGFAAQIKELVTKAIIDPHKLCIEITESVAMHQPELVVAVMNELREFGVRFAIDDFGTGYSSLVHLKTLPIDTLKIDRSFITDIKDGSTDAEIVKAIIAMTAQMGIRTIAEGVETKAVAEYLVKNGCSYHQGWVYGKAEPLDMLFPPRAHQSQDNTTEELGFSFVH